MAMQSETTRVKKKVGMLENVDVEFVSLVEHGANQQPFRVVKQEGGERFKMKDNKVQAILVPNDMTMEDLAKDEKFAFLTEAITSKAVKFETYTKYVQADVEKFEKDSIRLVKLKGASLAIVGSLVPGVEDRSLLSLGDEVEKAAIIPINSVFDIPVEGKQLILSFGDLFHRELDSFISIIMNALRQSSGDSKKRKQIVLSAFEAFKNFMVAGLDAIGTEKMDSTVLDKIQESFKMLGKEDSHKPNLEEIDMIEKKEIQEMIDASNGKLKTDLTASVAEIVAKTILDIETKKADKVKSDDANKAKETEMQTLVKSVKELTEKVAKIGDQPNTDSAANDADDKEALDKEKKDKEKADKEKNDSLTPEQKKKYADDHIYDGLLLKAS